MAPSLYPVLRPGRHGCRGPSSEEVAKNQRARLAGALVEMIAECGYEELRTRELCKRAGVSKGALYRHFKGGVHSLFMAVFEQVSDRLIYQLTRAWRRGDEPRERLLLAVMAFAEAVAAEPASARLALCEPFAAGPSAMEAASRVHERLAAMLAQAFEEASGHRPLPLLTRGVIAGLGGVARVRLLERRESQLPDQVARLAEWAFRCLQAPAPNGRELDEVLCLGYRPSAALLGGAVREDQDERSRILAATAALAARRGYGALRERTIREAARVTRRQFYEHFEDEHDAFVGVLELMWARALRYATVVGLSADSWPTGVHCATVALLDCLLADQPFMRLSFVELPATGTRGLRDRQRLIAGSAQRLVDSAPLPWRPDAPVAHASLVAAWTIVYDSVAHGERLDLGAVVPSFFLALMPAGAPSQHAGRIEPPRQVPC